MCSLAIAQLDIALVWLPYQSVLDLLPLVSCRPSSALLQEWHKQPSAVCSAVPRSLLLLVGILWAAWCMQARCVQ